MRAVIGKSVWVRGFVDDVYPLSAEAC